MVYVKNNLRLLLVICFGSRTFIDIYWFLCLLEGPGAGRPIVGTDGFTYGTGASHGGEAGAEDSSHEAPSAYGNFISPDRFGSAGGDVLTNTSSYKGKLNHYSAGNKKRLVFSTSM